MHGDRLGLAARVLHDLHCAALDDEEFVVTCPCLEQRLAGVQQPARAELGQRGDLGVVEFGESDPVQVLIGHGSTSPPKATSLPHYRKYGVTSFGTSRSI